MTVFMLVGGVCVGWLFVKKGTFFITTTNTNIHRPAQTVFHVQKYTVPVQGGCWWSGLFVLFVLLI